MTAEEKELPKSKPRISIPAGAVAILPLRNMVLFPSTVMPLVVGRPSSLQAIEEAVRQQVPVGLVAQQDPVIEVPRPQDLFRVGTAADVLRMFGLPDGQRQIIIQGRQRFEIAEFLETDPFFIARVTMIEEQIPQSKQFEARILHLRQQAVKALGLLPEPMSELKLTIERVDNPLALIDMIASTLDLALPEKQEILEIIDPEARAARVSEKLARQIELLAHEGRLCFVALMGGSKIEADFGAIQRKHLTVTGSTLRSRSVAQKASIIAALREKVWPLWVQGRLRPFTYRQFPLREAAAAHRLMESSEHIGKILLVP